MAISFGDGKVYESTYDVLTDNWIGKEDIEKEGSVEPSPSPGDSFLQEFRKLKEKYPDYKMDYQEPGGTIIPPIRPDSEMDEFSSRRRGTSLTDPTPMAQQVPENVELPVPELRGTIEDKTDVARTAQAEEPLVSGASQFAPPIKRLYEAWSNAQERGISLSTDDLAKLAAEATGLSVGARGIRHVIESLFAAPGDKVKTVTPPGREPVVVLDEFSSAKLKPEQRQLIEGSRGEGAGGSFPRGSTQPTPQGRDFQIMQLEAVLGQYAQGTKTAKEVQKFFKQHGWSVNLRGKKGEAQAFDPSGKEVYLGF